MKLFFGQRSLRLAITFSLRGGQALHVWQPWNDYEHAPSCFKQCKIWAHLFDQDAKRLAEFADSIGVKKVKIEHESKAGQHIDLCGQPLQKAMNLIEKEFDSSNIDGYTDYRKGGVGYDNCKNDSLGVPKLA